MHLIFFFFFVNVYFTVCRNVYDVMGLRWDYYVILQISRRLSSLSKTVQIYSKKDRKKDALNGLKMQLNIDTLNRTLFFHIKGKKSSTKYF